MKKLSLVGGFQDTRTNNEDFALTPFLFLVAVNEPNGKVLALGVSFGFWAVYLGIGHNLPTAFRRFSTTFYKKNK